MSNSNSETNFRDITARIDQLARQLEEPDLALEDAIKCYKEGTELLQQAQARLDEAEQQVRMLSAEMPANDDEEAEGEE